MQEPLTYRRLRAPRADGGLLAEPPLEAVGPLLAERQADRPAADHDFGGRWLSQLIPAARAELLAAALAYTRSYREVRSTGWTSASPFVLAGHQPQLFHPGVWIKNFALAGLAARHEAVGVNLVVDSDAARTAAVLVPGGTPAVPLVAGVPYDAPRAEVPYEERPIADLEVFASFGRRAAERLAPLVPDPLVATWWPAAVERARASGNLGLAVAQARHRCEGQWGAQSLELPQSAVCRFESFAWFAAHLLGSARRLREVYNAALAEYRRVNHIRSRSHPVPDLARDGDWIETPFWRWSSERPQRRRLFARRRGAELCLSDRGGLELALPAADGSAVGTVAALCDLPRGIKLRTRALATTLFARLVLSDLFLHGIGGAKYDELTDLICARFFGLRPPPYLVLSATLRLPVARPGVDAADLHRVDGLLRELAYHPEVHAPRPSGEDADGSESEFDRLANEKLRWVRTPSNAENARQRCRAIRAANEALQPWVEPLRRELTAERARLVELQRTDAVLASREYAFCLHPERTLRPLLGQVFP